VEWPTSMKTRDKDGDRRSQMGEGIGVGLQQELKKISLSIERVFNHIYI